MLTRHLSLALTLLASVALADWPTHRGDYRRSGVSTHPIDTSSLGQLWQWRSPAPPAPAWPVPARWDAWASIRDLRSMRNYDPCFHTTIAEDRLFFGSSADDSLYCLDLATGKPLWRFTAGGPIRIAPTIDSGKVYFGADDGFAYCLSAKTGSVLWTFSPVPSRDVVINNGRIISHWPIRTGIVVLDNTAYFGASLLPWKDSYLCAIDAATGKPQGPGRYVNPIKAQTMEGPMLPSGNRLIVPQGRVSPVTFDRATGKPQGSLAGTGGAFALLTDDDQIIHGPGNRRGEMIAVIPGDKKKLATYQRGNSVIVDADFTYVLDDNALTCTNRKTNTPLWLFRHAGACEILLAGKTLFIGARDRVTALDVSTGVVLWHHAVQGRAFGLAASAGRLIVSTDEGVIHCLGPGGKPIAPATQPIATPLPIQPPPPIENVSDKRLTGRWVFQQSRLEPAAPLDKRTSFLVRDLAGQSHGYITGLFDFVQAGKVQALELDGQSVDVEIASNLNHANLPKDALTLTAWVRIDQAPEWSAVLCALQDNGDFERGWMLGSHSGHFAFGLVAADGKKAKNQPKLTYLQSPTPIALRYWNHLAATYDGDTMRLYVNGLPVASSTEQKGPVLYPEQGAFALATYRDDNERHRFAGQLHEARVYNAALSEKEIAAQFAARKDLFPTAPSEPRQLADNFHPLQGPVLRFTGPHSARVTWTTDRSMPSVLELTGGPAPITLTDPAHKPSHQIDLIGLRRNNLYQYRILDPDSRKANATERYECDTHLNLASVPKPDWPPVDRHALEQSARILAKSSQKGLAVVMGIEDGALVHALAATTDLRVIVVDTDPAKLAALRDRFIPTGAYGSRLMTVLAPSWDTAPLPRCFANLLVSEHATLPITADAARNLISPRGVAWMDQRSTSIVMRNPLPGAADWTHMYAGPHNAAYNGEELANASSTSDLDIQWFGEPGPRHQVDRQSRKPSPLAVNGRLFIQGFRRILALDAYNGTILWTVESPRLIRFNVAHDSSNWCADDHHLFLAIDDQCWKIDQATGAVVQILRLNQIFPRSDRDWSYLARSQNLLLGSTVKPASSFTKWWGDAWWDEKSGPLMASDQLFALDLATGKKAWSIAGSMIINPTLTIAQDRIFYVESRNPALKNLPGARFTDQLWKDRFLVARDLQSGKLLWETPINSLPGHAAYYLAAAESKLALVSSSSGQFHIETFSQHDGKSIWAKQLPWEADHHGKHISRPAIVGGRLIVRPYVLFFESGSEIARSFPKGHGCGTYTLSKNLLFARLGDLTAWNLDTKADSRFNRVRMDCWISTIPASGMLLSPEGGGGCSCGSWMEMSAGFLPKPPTRPTQ